MQGYHRYFTDVREDGLAENKNRPTEIKCNLDIRMVTRTRKRTRRTRQRKNRSRTTYHTKSNNKRRSRNIRKKHKSIKGGGLSKKAIEKIYRDNVLPMFEEYVGQPPSVDQLRNLSEVDDDEFVAAISAMEPKFSFDPQEAVKIHKWVRNLPKKQLLKFAYDLIGKVKNKIGLKIKLPPSLIKQVTRRQRSRSQQSRDSGNLMDDVVSSLNILQSSRGGTGAAPTQHGGADLGVTILCIIMIGIFLIPLIALLVIFLSNTYEYYSRAGRIARGVSQSMESPQSMEAAAAAAGAAVAPEDVPPRAGSLRVPPPIPPLRPTDKTALAERDQRVLLAAIDDDGECSICLGGLILGTEEGEGELESEQDDIVILDCQGQHKYHKDCVMGLHGPPFTCPMCRTPLGGWSQIDKNVIGRYVPRAQP